MEQKLKKTRNCGTGTWSRDQGTKAETRKHFLEQEPEKKNKNYVTRTMKFFCKCAQRHKYCFVFQEVSRLREDNTESRREVERLRDERAGLQGQLMDTQRELGREKEVRREGEEERRMEREVWEREQQAASQLIQDLSREVNHRLYLYYYYKQTNET